MCGFVVVGNNSEVGLDTALESMVHRGPDNRSTVYLKDVSLGHVRLSIVDLSDASNQPFTDGLNYLVFNGEIYNFKSLYTVTADDVLEASAIGDTHVLFNLLSGDRFCNIDKIEGPYAFVFYDFKENKLYFSCDFFEEKQLYYILDNEEIYLCSTLQGLRHISPVELEKNLDALDEVKNIGYVGTQESTIYKNVVKVSGKYLYTYDLVSKELSKTRKPEVKSRDNIDSLVAFRNLFHSRFRISLKNRLNCDVPYGLLLSGGVDSTYILVTMIEELGIKPMCYTLQENGGLEWQNIMALKEKYDLSLVVIDHPDSFRRIAATAIEKMDSPFIDPAYFSLYYLVSQIPSDIKVLLSGDGADEIFWSYADTKLLFKQSKIISLFKPLILYLNNMHSHFAKYLLMQKADMRSKWKEYKLAIEKREVAPFEEDPMSSIMSNLSQRLLIKSDKASMAFSKEMRSPFLDRELLAICLGAMQSGINISSKNVMKDYIYLKVPSIRKIRKRGFNSGGKSAGFEFIEDEKADVVSYLLRFLD